MSVHKYSSTFHGLVSSVLTHFPVFPSPPDHPQETGKCLFGRVSATDTVPSIQKLHLNSQVVQSCCLKKKYLHISEVGARSCSTYKDKSISYWEMELKTHMTGWCKLWPGLWGTFATLFLLMFFSYNWCPRNRKRQGWGFAAPWPWVGPFRSREAGCMQTAVNPNPHSASN